MIDVQNVSKVYEMPGESVSVLAGIDFEVRQGETAAVVGPSGSGKTTLLNLLGALDRPARKDGRTTTRNIYGAQGAPDRPARKDGRKTGAGGA